MSKDYELVLTLSPKELPEPYQTMANIVGVETTAKVINELGGTTVYFPSLKKLVKSHRNELICSEYKNGSRITELSKKYGLSESSIYSVLSANTNDEANTTESANSTKTDKGNASNGFMDAVLQNQFRR